MPDLKLNELQQYFMKNFEISLCTNIQFLSKITCNRVFHKITYFCHSNNFAENYLNEYLKEQCKEHAASAGIFSIISPQDTVLSIE